MQRQQSCYTSRFNRNKKNKYSNNNTNRANPFNKKKQENKNEFSINEKEFPEIKKENNTNPIKSKETLNFKKINFEDTIPRDQEINKLKNGWLILNKENLEKRKKKQEEIKNNITKEEITRMYQRMIINWERFREAENNLLGDRSRFINNDQEIEKIIEEEIYIKKQIEEYNEDIKNNNIQQDTDIYNESELIEYF